MEQGDIIGVYSTRANIISMSTYDLNQKEITKLTGNNGIYQGQPSLPETEFSNVGKRDVSLRAFVAGRCIIR